MSEPIYSDDEHDITVDEGGRLMLSPHLLGSKVCLGSAGSLSIFPHESGCVLTTVDWDPWVVLTGDILPLLRRGVVDRRNRWASIVQLFVEHMRGNSAVVPFFTADDPFDLNEAKVAVQMNFMKFPADGSISAKIWSSQIHADHPHKLKYQGQGWFDVLNGLWGDFSEYPSADAFIEANRKHLAKYGVQCLIMQDVQNIEVCDHGVSYNFIFAIDDAITLVKSWGMQCALTGTIEAWWALKAQCNGPSKYDFRHIHIPGDNELTPAFRRTMQLKFSQYVMLEPELLERVYEKAGHSKYRALTLIEHLIGISHERDGVSLSVHDLDAFCGESESMIPAAQ